MTTAPSHRPYIRLWDRRLCLFECYARRVGLQGKSLAILLWLYHSPNGCTQGYLAEKTQSTKQVVHATIKSWLAKGYVSLCSATKDKREKKVCLTPDGFGFAQPIISRLHAMEAAAMADFSDQELDQLVALTSRYVTALEAQMKEMTL